MDPILKKKSLSIMLATSRKTDLKIDLFESKNWHHAAGSGPGKYRIMVDGKWIGLAHDQYTFFTLDGITKYAKTLIAAALGCDLPAPKPPDIKDGGRVRIKSGEVGGMPIYDKTFACGNPIQGISGRWFIGVIVVGRGMQMVAVDELEVD